MLTRRWFLGATTLLLACELSAPPPEAPSAQSTVSSAPAAPLPETPTTCEAPGILQSSQTVVLSAAESGVIERPLPRGARVDAGDVVATFSSPSLDAAVRGVTASLQVTRAERGAAKQRAALAEDRISEVNRLGEFAGESERRDVNHARALSLQELRASTARVREREAAARGSRARQDALTIRAPFEATIADVFVDAGAHVSSGSPVLRLVAPSRDHIRFAIPESQHDAVRAGASVSWTTPDGGAQGRARVTALASEVDARAGVLVVEAELHPPAPSTLPSGMGITVNYACDD
ncbi:MAG: efflux RND transporter periplasmic adaptor subunit [Nannocystales bacterium]